MIGSIISIIYSVDWKSPLEDWMVFILLTLSVFYYSLGKWLLGSREQGFWANPFASAGALGIASITLMLTWDGVYNYKGFYTAIQYSFNDYVILVLMLISFLGISGFIWKKFRALDITEWTLLTSFLLAILGFLTTQIKLPEIMFVSLANLYVLIASIIIMSQGISRHRLMLLNAGLLWFSILILFRFFDSDIPFVLKGIVFILIGSAFVGVNIWYNKKQKQKEEGVV